MSIWVVGEAMGSVVRLSTGRVGALYEDFDGPGIQKTCAALHGPVGDPPGVLRGEIEPRAVGVPPGGQCAGGVALLGADVDDEGAIGAETLWVVQAVYLSKWFFDQEMSFAIGINYAVPNIFSTIAGSTVPRVYGHKGFGYALGIGATFTIVSFCMAICLVILDKRMEAHDKEIEEAILLGEV